MIDPVFLLNVTQSFSDIFCLGEIFLTSTSSTTFTFNKGYTNICTGKNGTDYVNNLF